MMIDTSHIIILALIQGITEFLPISSSGHLVLLPAVTGLADQGQLLDVAAHFGTLGAVLLYVRRDIIAMLIGVFSFGKHRPEGMALAMMLIMASLPVIFVGLIIELLDPAFLRMALTVAVANVVFALLLYKADTDFADTKQMQDVTMRDALAFGFAQIFALIPGTSRSGVTMTAARARGFSRHAAARFSMLMAVPVIAGATLLKSRHFFGDEAGILAEGLLQQATLVAGLSFITALAAITLLMRWLAHADFKIFVYYRIALGLVLIVALALGVI